MRMQAAHVEVGDKFHRSPFAAACVAEGASLIDMAVRHPVHGVRPTLLALGISSDLEVILDGVPLGKPASCPLGKAELLLVGVTGSTVSGSSRSTLVGARDHGTSKTAEACRELLTEELARAGISRECCRASMATVSVDGALCVGSKDSGRYADRAGELLCRWAEREDCTRWDVSHTINKCGKEALSTQPWVGCVLKVAEDIRNAFGGGQGASLAEAVACHLGGLGQEVRYASPAAPCGTRMVGYLVLVPQRLLENLPWFAGGACARGADRSHYYTLSRLSAKSYGG